MYSQFGLVDALILLVYLSILLGIGLYFSKKQKSFADFTRGGRQVGWLPLGLSLMAATNSGIDYLQTPAVVYRFGIIWFAVVLTWVPTYYWLSRVTLPLFRRLDAYSVYEYLERRFGPNVRTAAAGIFVLWRVSWMGAALYVPCLATKAATGYSIDTTWMIIGLGTIVTVYTMLGGMKAVIWTDVAQFCIMFGGLLATIVFIVSQIPGGLAEVFAVTQSAGKLQLSATIPDDSSLPFFYRYFTTELTLIGFFIYILVAQITLFTCDQVAMQRLQSARSTKEGKYAFVIGAFSASAWTVFLGCVGLALYTFYQQTAPPQGLRNDSILPYFMANHFPVGLTGLVLGAIFAASLSSVDSAINATTSIIVVDFYQRYRFGRTENKIDLAQAEQPRLVLVSRITNVCLGAVIILVACQVENLGELYTAANTILGAFFGPLLGIFLLGLFSKVANSRGIILGTLAGLATSCFLSFFSELTWLHSTCGGLIGESAVDFLKNLSWQWPSPIGVIVTLVIGQLTSLIGRHSGAR